jgi:endonuclease/exonuclease/phosphatase family metal-dependent hydrolase
MKTLFYLLLLPLLFVGEVFGKSPAVFTIGTYNLRNANKQDSLNGNGWGQRSPFIAKLVMFHGFDIFGTQEGLCHQLQDLKKLMPEYEYIGVARDDGKEKGEYSAIFYRKGKFKLLDHGDFWLSKDESKPNLGWDAVCIRICTWGKFQEISTGRVFVFFNLHMDHKGIVAREESSKLILKKIQEMPEGIPVVLTGDFNVSQFSPSYQLLNTSGKLRDAYDKSPLRYDPAGTFNGFNPEGSSSGERIDHIFLTDQFSVLKYGILTDTYRVDQPKLSGEPANGSSRSFSARCPSDHFPVMIVVGLP